jgi:hypothetical protein
MGSAIKRVANYAVSDTAYGAGWDGVTDVAPSKNAVYDQMELRAPKANPIFTGTITSEQPIFSAAVTSNVADVTGDNTVYSLLSSSTPACDWTEILDSGGNFSNGTFTAPVTGKYLLAGSIAMEGLDAVNHLSITIYIVTSNRIYSCWFGGPSPCQVSTGRFTPSFSRIADMDAGDTAYLQLSVSGPEGYKVVDIRGIVSTTYLVQFQGYLLP